MSKNTKIFTFAIVIPESIDNFTKISEQAHFDFKKFEELLNDGWTVKCVASSVLADIMYAHYVLEK